MGNTTDGSAQFTNTVCFQAKGATQANVILGQGAYGEGWHPNEKVLPLQGMFLPRSPEHTDPDNVCRGDWISPDAVMDVIARYAEHRPQLGARCAAARDRILSGTARPNGSGPGRQNGGTKRPIGPQDARPLRIVHRFPVSKEPIGQGDSPLWALLQEMAGKTASPPARLAAKLGGRRAPPVLPVPRPRALGGVARGRRRRDADGVATSRTTGLPPGLPREAADA